MLLSLRFFSVCLFICLVEIISKAIIKQTIQLYYENIYSNEMEAS